MTVVYGRKVVTTMCFILKNKALNIGTLDLLETNENS